MFNGVWVGFSSALKGILKTSALSHPSCCLRRILAMWPSSCRYSYLCSPFAILFTFGYSAAPSNPVLCFAVCSWTHTVTYRGSEGSFITSSCPGMLGASSTARPRSPLTGDAPAAGSVPWVLNQPKELCTV